jgi:hypothetical protein
MKHATVLTLVLLVLVWGSQAGAAKRTVLAESVTATW